MKPATNNIDPVVADLLDRLLENLRAEFAHRIEQLEFRADYPNRLITCLGLLDALHHSLITQTRRC